MNALSRGQALLVRSLGGVVAPSGRFASLLVLIYHRVLATPDSLLKDEPDANAFAAQMDLVKDVCSVLPLSEAVDRLDSGTLPARAACVTFDDGYANNRTIAAPILKAREIPATVFVASGYLNGGRMWNDTIIESIRRARDHLVLDDIGLGTLSLTEHDSRRKAIDATLGALKYCDPADRVAKAQIIAERVGESLPDDLMMTEQHIRELSQFGMEVGAHTVTHPILDRIPEELARREIAESKSVLQAMTGLPVTLFAYPNGRPGRDYDRSHVSMVREAGYRAAVSTAWGAAGRRTDRYQIPRMLPWHRSPLRFCAQLLRTYRQQGAETA